MLDPEPDVTDRQDHVREPGVDVLEGNAAGERHALELAGPDPPREAQRLVPAVEPDDGPVPEVPEPDATGFHLDPVHGEGDVATGATGGVALRQRKVEVAGGVDLEEDTRALECEPAHHDAAAEEREDPGPELDLVDPGQRRRVVAHGEARQADPGKREDAEPHVLDADGPAQDCLGAGGHGPRHPLPGDQGGGDADGGHQQYRDRGTDQQDAARVLHAGSGLRPPGRPPTRSRPADRRGRRPRAGSPGRTRSTRRPAPSAGARRWWRGPSR